MKQIRIFLMVMGLLFMKAVYAIPHKNAELIVLNKISATSEVRQVMVGEATLIGAFSVIVRICDKAPPEDPPESGAFLDVVQNGNQIFEGWMFASNPALNSMEHPVYDIWLQKCF